VLISRTAQDVAAAGLSGSAALDADGTRLAFESEAADLVPGDTNGVSDVFLADRRAGTMRRVSLTAAGAQAPARSLMPALSADGRWLAFRADGPMTLDPAPLGGLYLLDLDNAALRLLLADMDGGRGRSDFPAISADGGVVVFESTVALTSGSAASLASVLAWQRSDGTIRRVSPAGANAAARDAAVSGDGRVVAYASEATNIGPSTSGRRQVYLTALDSDVTELSSVTALGQPANGDSGEPTLSGDGRWLAFTSLATDLVAKDVNGVTDIFLRDRAAGSTRAVTDVLPGNDVYHPGDSSDPVLAVDGSALAFASKMYTLTPGDRNQAFDIYHLRLPDGLLQRISLRQDGAESARPSWAPAISGDGRSVAFTSTGELAPEDTNELADVYLWRADAVAQPSATHGGGHNPTATSLPHGTATPTRPHLPTATSGHDPSPTAGHHDTATPGHHDTATPIHHATATQLHHATATPVHHATATPFHHDTATPGHHATATPLHHATATPDGHSTVAAERFVFSVLFFPAVVNFVPEGIP
jgi:Tol biopolymer transport system component